MRLLCFNPHDDDVIIGVGGTVIKLLTKNWEVAYVYITDGRHGSYELSPEETVQIRAEEATKEREFLGIKDYWRFRVEDLSLKNLTDEQITELQNRVLDMIKIYQPDALLIPSISEMHPDHRATHYIISEAIKSRNLKIPIIKYIVWSFPNFYQNANDKCDKILLVDVDKEFGKKLDAIKIHKSQVEKGKYDQLVEHFNSYLSLIFKAFRNGVEKVEILGLSNLHEENKNIINTLMNDLNNPKDVSEVLHGRQEIHTK